jgi:SAM-dependent methyltransferase
MKLGPEVKDLIRKEYEEFKESMYANKSLAERQELDQFFTPPEISIRLIEELSDLSGNVLDPTSGSGNLLAAALIAGADSDKVFGNDYDYTMVVLCRDRLNRVCKRLGKPLIKDWQIHQGNALHKFALTYFGDDYEDYYFGNIKDKARRLNNLKQIKLAGSLDLYEYELDHKIYN